MFLFTIIERWFRAESKSSFSSASTTAKACFCIPLIAIVVFSKIEPTAIDTTNETISIVSKLIPKSNATSNMLTIVTTAKTIKMPPNNSFFGELFLVKGTSTAISFPIQAVG